MNHRHQNLEVLHIDDTINRASCVYIIYLSILYLCEHCAIERAICFFLIAISVCMLQMKLNCCG